MQIIVHYPKSAEDIKILKLKVAEIHTEAVKSHIKNLSCPTGQKRKLIDAILDK